MIGDPPEFLKAYARLTSLDPRTIAAVSLRYRSDESVTLLSLMASGGTLTYDGVLAAARRVVSGETRAGTGLVDLDALAALARAISGRPAPGPDYSEAADLHQALRLLGHRPRRKDDTHRLEAQTNLAVGRHDYVERILPEIKLDDDSRWMFETDLVNPAVGRPESTEGEWLRSFNRLFTTRGLMPIALADGDEARFDRIRPAGEPAKVSHEGPTVTIIMSVFKPDQSLFTALRSLIDQTWPHLEILMVDDCSGPEFTPLLTEAAAMDERIELIVMPQNGGTYKIRNMAIARARGEFIGFQDSDDWSHPERIQRQLEPLLDNPDLVASASRAVRVTADVAASKVGYPTVRPNASSLVFRRDVVMQTLGAFDEVRKSADMEFGERVKTVFGRERIAAFKEPFALVQLSHASLSLEDFRFGWQDADRVFYRDAINHWHDQIAAGTESPRLDPAAPRRFAAPDRFFGKTAPVADRAHVLLISDWRPGNSRCPGNVQEMTALSESGLVTGVAHAEAMRHADDKRIPPSAAVLDLRAAGRILTPAWRDDLRAQLVLVDDPELLSYPRPATDVRLRADRVVIRAAYPPRAPGDGALVYEPEHIQGRAQELFGVQPEWLPTNDSVAKALVDDGAANVLDPQLLGAIDIRQVRRLGLRGGPRPVIGTTGISSLAEDRPDWQTLLDCFPDDDRFDVRIRDTHGALARIRPAGSLPPNWLVDPGPLTQFVRQLDVFVGLPTRTWGPDPMRAAAAAMSQGCVVVLDPAYEPAFGDAARYWGGGPPSELIQAVVEDEAGFVAQQQRGYDFVASEMSPEAFATRIGAFIGAPSKENEAP